MEPEIYRGRGLHPERKITVDRSILEELSRENVLAIATGRPRSEAEYPLKHFQLRQFFPLVLTLDDCVSEEKRIFEEEGRTVSLSKPDPFMLDAIAEGTAMPSAAFFTSGICPMICWRPPVPGSASKASAS
jgi:phosphoglycolate phosphatase-like HAD superfamily hydrolase